LVKLFSFSSIFAKKVDVMVCRYPVSAAECPVTVALTFAETAVGNVDSLQITVHSLAINNTGRHGCQNSVQSVFPLTQSGTRQLNLLHKPSEQRGTVYFVEYEIPVVKRVMKNVSRFVKETRPWHSGVKRFCSRKRVGSGNWPDCNLVRIYY
jgi:hypothetical protein